MTDERKERVSDSDLRYWASASPLNPPPYLNGQRAAILAKDLRDCRAERDELRERVRELEQRDYESTTVIHDLNATCNALERELNALREAVQMAYDEPDVTTMVKILESALKDDAGGGESREAAQTAGKAGPNRPAPSSKHTGREKLSEPHPQGSRATISPSSSSPGLSKKQAERNKRNRPCDENRERAKWPR
jgi:hypothetical protein